MFKRYENLYEGYGNPEPSIEKAEKDAKKVFATKIVADEKKLSIARKKPEFKALVDSGRIKVAGNEVWFWNNDYEAKAATNFVSANL